MNQAITIGIGGALNSSYNSAMKSAKQKTLELGKIYRDTNKKLAASKDVSKYKTMLGDLQAKQLAAGGGSRRLAAGILEAEKRYRSAKTAAKSYGLSIGNIAKEQKKLALTSKLQGMKLGGRQKMASAGGFSGLAGKAMPAMGATAAFFSPALIAADFEKSLSKVKALTGATGKEFDALSNQARELGRTTKYSATEAADAMSFLGMAGFKTTDIMKSMPAMLSLAAASGQDLATTADIASNILSGFNLEAEEMGRVADVIAKAASSSNQDVGMLGEAMKYVAPVSASLNVSLEETAAMIGKMSDAGIQASQAGTTLRSAMLNLSAPTTQGAKQLDAMGVATKDASGNMLPMTSILKAMNEATAEMGSAEKAEAMKDIFGKQAVSGMIAVMETAKSGDLQKFTKDLQGAKGAAKEMADTMNDNSHGDFKRMMSALSDIGITIGNVLLPPLSLLMQGVASILGPIGSFAAKNKWLTTALVALGGVLLFMTTVLPFLATGLTVLTGAFAVMSATLLANPIGLIAAGIALGAALIMDNWEPISQFFTDLFTNPKKAFSDFMGLVWTIFKWSPLGLIMQGWGVAFDYISKKISWVGDAWKKIKGWFGFGSDDTTITAEGSDNTVNDTISKAQATTPAAQAGNAANSGGPMSIESIQVHAAPGMDEELLAELTAQKIQEAQESQARGALHD